MAGTPPFLTTYVNCNTQFLLCCYRSDHASKQESFSSHYPPKEEADRAYHISTSNNSKSLLCLNEITTARDSFLLYSVIMENEH